jgi:hypothetical protein
MCERLLELRTSDSYKGREDLLAYPDESRVEIQRPQTPHPLSDEEIAAEWSCPVGGPPVHELARGAPRPRLSSMISQGLPAECILPALLRGLGPLAGSSFVTVSHP